MHSGLTQEWYLNRVQLDDHAEDLLAIRVGVAPRTLLREAMDAVVQAL